MKLIIKYINIGDNDGSENDYQPYGEYIAMDYTNGYPSKIYRTAGDDTIDNPLALPFCLLNHEIYNYDNR